MESKNKFWKGVLIGALVTAFAGLIVVGGATGIFLIGMISKAQVQSQAEVSNETDNSINWEQVETKAMRIQSIVEHYFLFEEDKQNVEEYIYKGLMAGLNDPYSVYYTQEEFEELMEDTMGEYCGIGALVSKNFNTGIVSISKVFKGAPAEEAGLRAGDIFYEVDSVEVTSDLDLDILVKQHVKGEEGTKVHLKMFRPSLEDYIEVDVVRRKIEVPTIEYSMKENDLGYLSVTQFDDVTTEQFKAAINDLEKSGMKGLIIDLRGNPGGVLEVAVDMLDYMLPDNLTKYAKEEKRTLIVSTADKNQNGDKYYCRDGHSVDLPVVILIDENSASASEVFAGAMRDYDRAKLVGMTSFGKGIVQTLLPLGDGSAVKLTTAHYYSPSGFDLHGVGLEPDEEIAFVYPESSGVGEEFTDKQDNQLQKAMEVLQEMIGEEGAEENPAA